MQDQMDSPMGRGTSDGGEHHHTLQCLPSLGRLDSELSGMKSDFSVTPLFSPFLLSLNSYSPFSHSEGNTLFNPADLTLN